MQILDFFLFISIFLPCLISSSSQKESNNVNISVLKINYLDIKLGKTSNCSISSALEKIK